MIKHPFEPLYDSNSKILILGSFPSVKSREQNFFYGHPQNRFWRVISAVLGEECPKTVEQKREMLLKHGVALWDSIASCDIVGSSDSSIKNVTPNDIGIILDNADIKIIFTNGKTSDKYFNKYIRKMTGRDAICLPSTSAANAMWSVSRLYEVWCEIAIYLDK